MGCRPREFDRRTRRRRRDSGRRADDESRGDAIDTDQPITGGPASDDPVGREYARLAARYDSRWAAYVAASVGETLSRLDLASAGALLDIGCGTGALLGAVSDAAPGVTLAGADPSPEMLAVARARLGAAAALECAPAERLPFADGAFDVVVSTSALHFFRRPDTALAEARRVLAPGGRIVVTDWCRDYLTIRLLDAYLRAFNRAHWRTYTVAECQRLLADAGFEGIAIERYKISTLWGMMTATARKPA